MRVHEAVCSHDAALLRVQEGSRALIARQVALRLHALSSHIKFPQSQYRQSSSNQRCAREREREREADRERERERKSERERERDRQHERGRETERVGCPSLCPEAQHPFFQARGHARPDAAEADRKFRPRSCKFTLELRFLR